MLTKRRSFTNFQVVLAGIGLVLSELAFGQSVFVPLSHWAYEFVERLEARGAITGVLNGTRPYSRAEMAGYLLQVEGKVEQGALSLNSVETRQMSFLRFEFAEEIKQLSGKNGTHYESRIAKVKKDVFAGRFPAFLYRNNRNLFMIDNGTFRAYLDPIFYQQWLYANPDSVAGTERVFERTHGFTVHGGLSNQIGFFFDFRDTKEWGTRAYPRLFDISLDGLGFVNGYGTHIWHDETNAYLVFKLPYMQLMVGKDWNRWGPGYSGALSLSTNATSFDQIKLQSRFWRLKFTWLLGFLRTFPRILDLDGTTKPKSLVAHRLELDVASWLDIGLYETVVFGNRRFELAYLNPINFYRSAEHFLGDDDNASIGADFELLLFPNLKLYGELFIDDLSTSQGLDFFGNKTGTIAGAFWVDAFRIPNLDGRLEYVRTRPYLYTHRQEINRSTHFNSILGHWIGPNAEMLTASFGLRLSRYLDISASFERWRHGANEAGRNVGGDVNRPFADGDAEHVAFLEGVLEQRHAFGFFARYEFFRNLQLMISLKTSESDNILPSDDMRRDIKRNEIFVNIALNR